MKYYRKRGIMTVRQALFLVGSIVLLTSAVVAQELNCEITVNTENIPSAVRDNLRTFEGDVRKYINNNRYTDEDLGGEKIDCSMTIFFLTGNADYRYTAQVIVVSQRPIYTGNDKSGRNTQVLRILDEKWEFTYMPNQPMNKDDYRFDALTSFLDFYAYLVISCDLETYIELSGARYLQKAQNLCNAASASAFSAGWLTATAGSYSRLSIIDELTNMKYQQFREAFTTYHFDGLDLLSTDSKKGLDNMLKAVESIADMRQKQNPRSILVRTFFDSKYLEIAESFLQWPDRSVYDRLIVADPAHQGTYDTYRRR
jgi:hypothetical protein